MRMPRSVKCGKASLVFIAAVTLAGCTLTATGTGTVTITSDTPATAFTGTSPYGGTPWPAGDVLALCAAGVVCGPDISGSILYWYQPAAGATQGVFGPGSPVLDPAGNTVPLPSGSYRISGIDFSGASSWSRVQTADFVIGDFSPDLSIWMESTARESSQAACDAGWTPSWASWPNTGTGGFVCNRMVYKYYPDRVVVTQ